MPKQTSATMDRDEEKSQPAFHEEVSNGRGIVSDRAVGRSSENRAALIDSEDDETFPAADVMPNPEEGRYVTAS